MSLILRRPKPTQRGYLSRAESRRAYLRSKPRFLNTISRIKLQPQTPPPVLNPLSRQGISPFDAFLNNSYSWLASYFGNDDKNEAKDEAPKKSLLEQVREAVDRTYAMKGKKRKSAVDDLVMDKDVKQILGLEPREIDGVPAEELKNMPPPDAAVYDPDHLYGDVVDIDDLAEKVGANPFNFDDELFDEYKEDADEQIRKAERKKARRIAEAIQAAEMDEARKIEEERMKAEEARIIDRAQDIDAQRGRDFQIAIPESVSATNDVQWKNMYTLKQLLRKEAEKTGELDIKHPMYVFAAIREPLLGKQPNEPWIYMKREDGDDVHTYTWGDRERILREIADEEAKKRGEEAAREDEEWEDEIKARDAKRKAEETKWLAESKRKAVAKKKVDKAKSRAEEAIRHTEEVKRKMEIAQDREERLKAIRERLKRWKETEKFAQEEMEMERMFNQQRRKPKMPRVDEEARRIAAAKVAQRREEEERARRSRNPLASLYEEWQNMQFL